MTSYCQPKLENFFSFFQYLGPSIKMILPSCKGFHEKKIRSKSHQKKKIICQFQKCLANLSDKYQLLLLSYGILFVHLSCLVVSVVHNLLSSLFRKLFTTLVNTYEVERSCMWKSVMTCPCHRLKWLCLPHPLSCTFLFTFVVNVHLGSG